MDDLMQFLRDRLTEDEQIARVASRPPWQRDYRAAFMHGIRDAAGRALVSDGLMKSQDVCHIVHHDPARVLREVEAKRGLLKRYEEPETSAALSDSFNKLTASVERTVLIEVFRHLALTYADHPDYREEWRP
ncbi:DUF6221 family protein [Streptomyces sp. NPDC058231]|uniref:DUF6221 family protein n=1 Tax=Streptomyces sp. NPDC058231 TaxID=3346392 RepID=UPI0036E91148